MSLSAGYDTKSLQHAAGLLRRGGAFLLVLVLLAWTLAVFLSYQYQAQAVHNLAFDRVGVVNEALERQGYQMGPT